MADTLYHYTLPWVVLDSQTATFVANRNDGILLDRDGQQVDAYTSLGVPTQIRTGPAGTTVPFQARISSGRVRFGDVEAAVFADETADALPQALAAAEAATAAQAAAERVASTATLVSNFYRDPDGEVWYSPTPVTTGGGQPVQSSDGLYIRFAN